MSVVVLPRNPALFQVSHPEKIIIKTLLNPSATHTEAKFNDCQDQEAGEDQNKYHGN